MRLESAQGLKQQLLKEVVEPFVILASRLRGRGKPAAKAGGLAREPIAFGVSARPLDTVPKIPRSIALGVARQEGEYKLAVRVQRPSLVESPLMEHLTRQARGEVDVRVVGRIDKRTGARRAARSSKSAAAAERVARLRFWIRLKQTSANFVDAALAEIDKGVRYNASRLRGLVRGEDGKLIGLGPAFTDEGETVFKIGRTTGATGGRVTAFDLDNVIVNYDKGNLRFDGQVEIEGVGNAAFSDGGDSGSLIVNARMEAVALLFAGGDRGGSNGLGLTYANPLRHVLKDLKATLLF